MSKKRGLSKIQLNRGKNKLPVNAQLLSVGTDYNGILHVWAIIDTSQPPVDTLAVFLNDDLVPPEPGKYLGTFKSIDTDYHVFQLSGPAQVIGSGKK